MKFKIFLVLVVILAGAQLFRPSKNLGQSHPTTDVSNVVSVPENVMTILETSCYDCHSNKTTYFWYHEIMPLGWWLNGHVEDGKKHLNFSEFSKYPIARQDHKLEEVAEEVEHEEMPLKSYIQMHPKTKLNSEQTRLIVDWVTDARASLAK